jgi:broad specificity phosphatase PhoE
VNIAENGHLICCLCNEPDGECVCGKLPERKFPNIRAEYPGQCEKWALHYLAWPEQMDSEGLAIMVLRLVATLRALERGE